MGYLRARRSVKIGSGVKLNLNKRSVGVTVGGRGAHYSVNTRGQRTRTIGVPGTGISYVDRSGPLARSGKTRRPTAVAPAPAAPPAHPGLFARHFERAFYAGMQQLEAGDQQAALASFLDADRSDDKHRAISPALLVGVLSFQLGDRATASEFLERVTRSTQHLPDKLMSKYGAGLVIRYSIGERISFSIELGSAAASILLAECYRTTGRLQEAIGIVQQLYDHAPDRTLLLQLCNFYRDAEEWDEIVHATAGISNEDDVTLLLRILQAEAMEHQGLPDPARQAYRDALKSKRRDPELLKQGRYARAALYLRTGKRGLARRDLSRLYADDPEYRDVAAQLRELA